MESSLDIVVQSEGSSPEGSRKCKTCDKKAKPKAHYCQSCYNKMSKKRKRAAQDLIRERQEELIQKQRQQIATLTKQIRIQRLMMKAIEAFNELHQMKPEKLLSMLSDDFTHYFVDPDVPLRRQRICWFRTQLKIGYTILTARLKNPFIVPQFLGVEGNLILIKSTLLSNNKIIGHMVSRYRLITDSNDKICQMRIENEKAADEHCRLAGLDLVTAYRVAVKTIKQSGIPLGQVQTAEEAPLFCDMLFSQTEPVIRLLPEPKNEEPIACRSCSTCGQIYFDNECLYCTLNSSMDGDTSCR